MMASLTSNVQVSITVHVKDVLLNGGASAMCQVASVV